MDFNSIDFEKIKVLIFDWHRMIDTSDFRSFKERLVSKLNINEAELKDQLERLQVYYYLKGLRQSSKFWDGLKRIYKSSQSIIIEEQERFLTPHVDDQVLEHIILLRERYETALMADLSQDKAQKVRRYSSKQLWQAFDYIFFSGEENVIKRDDIFLKKFFSKCDHKAEECLFIDDNLRTLETVQRKGFKILEYKERDLFLSQLKELIDKPIFAS